MRLQDWFDVTNPHHIFLLNHYRTDSEWIDIPDDVVVDEFSVKDIFYKIVNSYIAMFDGMGNQSTVPSPNALYLLDVKPLLIVNSSYNPEYTGVTQCLCGHEYYRHFDTYEDMEPVGCKYCECGTFTPAPDNRQHKELLQCDQWLTTALHNILNNESDIYHGDLIQDLYFGISAIQRDIDEETRHLVYRLTLPYQRLLDQSDMPSLIDMLIEDLRRRRDSR